MVGFCRLNSNETKLGEHIWTRITSYFEVFDYVLSFPIFRVDI